MEILAGIIMVCVFGWMLFSTGGVAELVTDVSKDFVKRDRETKGTCLYNEKK